MKTNKFSFWTIFLIAFIILYQNFNLKKWENPESVIRYDVISYYAYLPATFIYKDITLSFIKSQEDFKKRIWYKDTPIKGKVIMTSMGLSLFYAPFFMLAHNSAHLFGYENNGFTSPYVFALIFSCFFYFLIGLFFLRKFLLEFFTDKIVATTLVLICLSTNLYWYVTIDAAMSHGFSFSLFSIFLYLTNKWHKNQSIKISFFIGIILGLITLVRPTNALLVIVFILWDIRSYVDLKNKISLFLKKYLKILFIIVLIIIIWIPQLIYWKTVSGQYLYYSYGSNERFFWNQPHIYEVLLGFRKGMLIYNPILWIALTGFFCLDKNYKKILLPIIIFSIINVYIISSWWCWWYGGGYSLRAFIDSYPLYAVPMAAFLSWMMKQKNLIKIPLVIICSLFFLKGSFSLAQYYYGSIHYDSMTKKAYFDSFARLRPSVEFYNYLEPPDYEKARIGIDALEVKDE